jgi:hypothetical protein
LCLRDPADADDVAVGVEVWTASLDTSHLVAFARLCTSTVVPVARREELDAAFATEFATPAPLRSRSPLTRL